MFEKRKSKPKMKNGQPVYHFRPNNAMRFNALMLLVFSWIIIYGFGSFWINIFQNDLLAGLLCGSAIFGGILLFCFIISALLFHYVFTNKLIVSSEGIEYSIFGEIGFVLWEDMERIGCIRLGVRDMWGIVFSQHVYAFRSYFRQSWFRGFIFSGYQDFPIPVQDFIGSDYGASHSIDLAKFENTKLGSAIHYYAPHLFEYDAEKDKRD